jgi:hypothetical protein
VMAKINVAKNTSEEELEDLITRISSYSNAQSKVSAVDLRSRNAQLIKLKTLSESIVTPGGKKWFFERARGEFNTLVRKNPQNKPKLNKDYPKERRFNKEELAKYYTAWGENPFVVKKGGEKVFRLFIEDISGDGKTAKPLQIDRDFYEDAIARIILFKSLEKLHGSRGESIGQLRSAVVPYAISVIYRYTTGDKDNNPFKLTEIWKKEGLDDQLTKVAVKLMILVNKLIKKYAESDDYGEYSKKPELWNKIKNCVEIKQFVEEDAFRRVIKRYCGSASVENGPSRKKKSKEALDFTPLYNEVHFYSTPEQEESGSLTRALDFIVDKYNSSLSTGKSVLTEFSTIRKQAAAKGAKHAAVFLKIGKALGDGELPNFAQIERAASYTDLLK